MITPAGVPEPQAAPRTGPAIAVLAATAVGAVGYLLLAPFPTAQDAFYAAIAFAAAGGVLAGVRRHRPARPMPWVLLAAGTGLFATGDLVWAILEVRGEAPFPSLADVAYLLGYPALMLAYLQMIVVRVGGGDRSGLLDAAILATAVGLVGWIWLLRPVLDGPGDPLALAVGVAYPMGDLLVMGVAIGMLATPGPRGPAFALLVGSLIVQFVGDLAYAVQVADEAFVDGGVLDVTWLASYAMVAAAAQLPSMRFVALPHPVRIAWLSPLRLVFTTLAMLTGPALVLVHQDRDVPLLVAGSGVLSVMIVLRLAVVVRALARDNAARRSLEDELGYRATHDPLTGLANRRCFLERLEERIAAAPDADAPASVLFLDLDDFKGVNDTLGHATGDSLLVAVAGRIRAHLREGDVAARMGGDEFGILLRADEPVAVAVAQRLLDALADPVSIGDRSVATSGSIGVAVVRPGTASADVLADADIAMYRAKAMGKGTVCAFRPELREGVLDRIQLEADLRAAIGGDGLRLEYLPIVDLRTGRPVAVEALVRWTHPVRGRLEPSRFIALADATGLGPALGTWVLETACRQVSAWRATLDPALCLAVNLSPRQLAGTELVAVTWNAATRAGLPLDALVVDVTEGALLLEAPEVAANLAALRALGTRVAIDDFGTGYTSLGYLARLPVDILKIDRAFVAQLDGGEDDGVAGIVLGLGETLGLEVIAEGVERPEQLERLRRLGCHLAQGFLLAPPMAPEAFAESPAVLGEGAGGPPSAGSLDLLGRLPGLPVPGGA